MTTFNGGGGGDDTITGPGADDLHGNGGNDTLDGAGGNDFIFGDAGNDFLYGNTGDDVISGGADDDSIAGGAGGDLLSGDWGNDTILGGAGDDVINGGLGDDDLNADAGSVFASLNDTASYAGLTSPVSVDLRAQGSFQDTGGGGSDRLVGFENITGSAQNDHLFGADGANILSGGGGNDTIYGFGGNDHILQAYVAYGGAGDDDIRGAVGYNSTDLHGEDGADYLEAWGALDGGDGNDTLVGGTYGSEPVYGSSFRPGAGDDIVTGLGTPDAGYTDFSGFRLILQGHVVNYSDAGAAVTVDLHRTDAQATGGSGTDQLTNIQSVYGSAFGDTLKSGKGVVVAGAGDDTVFIRPETASAEGGDGLDTLIYSAEWTHGANVTAPDLNGDRVQIAGFERYFATAYADTFTGGSGGEYVSAGAGGDSLLGADGADTLDGGGGNDTMDGGVGVDTADYSSAAGAVLVRLRVAVAQNTQGAGLDTLANFENLIGGSFGDRLTGSTASNRLTGGGGGDTIDAGAGADLLYGGDGDDSLLGGGHDDLLWGEAGNDTLSGGAGKDTLTGGAGQDVMSGGGDPDTFAFRLLGDSRRSGPDRITDLSGGDVIDLHLIDADTGHGGNQAFALVAALDSHAGQAALQYHMASNETWLLLDVDGDGKSDSTVVLAGDQRGFGNFIL
jgi:Ca2+-binding RTX toxin-like protein